MTKRRKREPRPSAEAIAVAKTLASAIENIFRDAISENETSSEGRRRIQDAWAEAFDKVAILKQQNRAWDC